jgi:hypothetical protein
VSIPQIPDIEDVFGEEDRRDGELPVLVVVAPLACHGALVLGHA